jgi:putative oxidoreductase
MGKYQAHVLSEILDGHASAVSGDDASAPRVIFTDPQVAAAGLTLQAAEAAFRHIHGVLRTAAGYTGGHGGRWVALTRWAAGIIFLIFGVAKFSDHSAELASFRHYPVPAPDVFVYLAGVIEIGSGLLLIMGLLTRLAALALAADMIGAIVISGLARGELVSLTLAGNGPALTSRS